VTLRIVCIMYSCNSGESNVLPQLTSTFLLIQASGRYYPYRDHFWGEVFFTLNTSQPMLLHNTYKPTCIPGLQLLVFVEYYFLFLQLQLTSSCFHDHLLITVLLVDSLCMYSH